VPVNINGKHGAMIGNNFTIGAGEAVMKYAKLDILLNRNISGRSVTERRLRKKKGVSRKSPFSR
jgi:hypothetical protein